jgi:hypothetical protein
VVKEGLEGLKKEEVKDASGNVIHDKKEVSEGDEKKNRRYHFTGHSTKTD